MNIAAATTEPTTYRQLLQSSDAVTSRINEMAATLTATYKNPLFVCLLRGGAPFAARLMFAIAARDAQFHPELDYMTVKTYGDERTSKPPELIMDLAPHTKVEGRTAIILDDVLDHGHTAAFASKHLASLGASQVDLVVLVEKERPRTAYRTATMHGFKAPLDWLTGMGMDDARLGKEANRWLDVLAIAHDNE